MSSEKSKLTPAQAARKSLEETLMDAGLTSDIAMLVDDLVQYRVEEAIEALLDRIQEATGVRP